MPRRPSPAAPVPVSDGGGSAAERRERAHDGDRQVLVVGEGLTAAATAGFLEQAGLDPVLASPERERIRFESVRVWYPGLTLLERVGLRRPVERHGTALDRLDCLTASRSWTRDDGSGPALVAIERSTLDTLLDRHLVDRVRTAERRVRSLEPGTAGVQVIFERGIEESFDAVVTADRSLVHPGHRSPHSTAVHAWEFEWPSDRPAPTVPAEAWANDRAAFLLPFADGVRAQLVATSDAETAAMVSSDWLADRFGRLFDVTGDPFGALADTDIAYRQVPQETPRSLHRGRAALVGPAARPTVPGSGLGPAFGVEDAWVLADALAYGPADVGDALATYERRRHQRSVDLCPRPDDDAVGTRVSAALSPPLLWLCGARSLAFSHAIDGDPPELARAVPEAL